MGKEMSKEKALQEALDVVTPYADREEALSGRNTTMMFKLILGALVDFEQRLKSLEAAVGSRGG